MIVDRAEVVRGPWSRCDRGGRIAARGDAAADPKKDYESDLSTRVGPVEAEAHCAGPAGAPSVERRTGPLVVSVVSPTVKHGLNVRGVDEVFEPEARDLHRLNVALGNGGARRPDDGRNGLLDAPALGEGRGVVADELWCVVAAQLHAVRHTLWSPEGLA